MQRLTFAPSALADLDGIADHIGENNPDAAGRFVQKVKETCRLIAGRPLMGRARNDLLPELRGFPVGNYLIFYDVTSDGIQVVRIVHGSRDLPVVFKT